MLRVAWFSPLPPARSGIADYSAELLPHLAQHVQLTLFAPDPAQLDTTLAAQFEVRPLDQYPAQRWQFDVALHQMGNSAHHAAHYDLFCRYPGLVVLHDYFLHHFLAHQTVGQGNVAGYVRELAYAYGLAGVNLARQIRTGQAQNVVFERPLNQRLLNLSLGTIVHSRYVQQLLAHEGHPSHHVPALITPHPAQPRRAELGIDDEAIVFGSFGQVNQARQFELSLRAFRQVVTQVPNAIYLIVGEVLPDVALADLIAAAGLTRHVRHIGYAATLQAFVDYLQTADIVINLRYPTLGETSAVALRALAAGKPTIVFDHGWYAELPDDGCCKLPPLDEAALVATMLQLAQSAELRQRVGETAVSYATNHHHPAAVAAQYAQVIGHTLADLRKKYA